MGAGRLTHQPQTDAPHEATYLKLDSSKSRNVIPWRPQLPLDEVLRWTVQWYKAYYADPRTARRLTESQIESYMERISSREARAA